MKVYVKILIKVIFVGLLVVLPVALFFSKMDFDLFKIQNVHARVTGPEILAPITQDVQSKAAKIAEELNGRYLWQMDVSKLKKKLLSDARISQASVVRNWLGQVTLNISLHEPDLLLATSRGQWSVLTRDGSLLPENTRFFDLPILRGELFKKNLNLRKQAQDLIQSLPAQGAITRDRVSEVVYDQVEGFSLHVTDSETLVRLGFEQFAFRLKLVERVMTHLEKHDLQSRVIDARFKQKVVVRLRNAP